MKAYVDRVFLMVYFSFLGVVSFEEEDNHTLTLGLSIPWEQGWLLGGQIGTAFVLGLKEVEQRQILPGYVIKWIWRDSYCEPRRGMSMVIDMWASVDLDGIIGDGCSSVCQPQALLAAAWNIPVVASPCANPVLANKATYPTFSRSGLNFADMDIVYNGFADMMGWEHICVLTTTDEVWKLTAEAARHALERNGKYVIFHVVETTVRGDQNDINSINALQDLFKTLKSKVKIIFVFSYLPDLENILMTAIEANMFNGEYNIVCGYQWHVDFTLRYPYKSEKERLALEGLIGIAVKSPSGQEYDNFRQQVIDEFQTGVFGDMPHIGPSEHIDSVNVYAGL